MVDTGGRRFQALWRRCCPAGHGGDPQPLWQELVRRYGEPHRHYHDLAHIHHCLVWHDRAAALMSDPDAVELALWFHDVVLTPGRGDNEARSAQLFRARAAGSLAPEQVERVTDLILATRHLDRPAIGDARYTVDIDLSSFALPWALYLRDTRNLRRERHYLPDIAYRRGHRGFLASLLARPSIFRTGFFRRRCERSARANITRYLARG